MTSWINSYLEKNPEMAPRRVLMQAETATHFLLAPGIARAVVTGAPQYFHAGGVWQPLDPTLQEDQFGKLGAPGLPTRIQPDGLITIAGKQHWQHTLSVGTLSGTTFSKIADLPAGRADGACLVREVGIFRHEIVLTERAVKEQLVISEKPSELGGEYLVYETAVPARAFPAGAIVGELPIKEGLRFPAGRAFDAQGRIYPLERFVMEMEGDQRVYTGLPLSIMQQASFPLVMDPAVTVSGHTGDSEIWGQASSYATARSTSTGVDNTFADVSVGQAYESAIPRYYVYRNFHKFDLSSISPQAEVLSATLGFVCVMDASTLADFDIQVVKQNWNGQDPLVDANRETAYDNCLAGAQDVIWRNTSGLALNTQYMSPPLDGSYLSLGGLVYYSLRGSRDKNNTPPASNGNEYIRIASANHGTPSYRPVLVIDYAGVLPAITRAVMPSLGITIVDTRIKLRARERNISLTTEVRSSSVGG